MHGGEDWEGGKRKKWKSRNIKTYKWKVRPDPAHEYDRIGRLRAPAGGLSIARDVPQRIACHEHGRVVIL